MQPFCLFFHKRFKTVKQFFIFHKRLKSSRFFIFHNRFNNAQMEEQLPNGMNNYDLHRDRDDRAIEIFKRVLRLSEEDINRGRVWQNLASQNNAEMMYSLNRLAAVTGTDHSIEGFERHLVSGGACRCICQGDRRVWKLESTWHNVDINHIKVAEGYEGPPRSSNGQRDVTITTVENNTIWLRVVNVVISQELVTTKEGEGGLFCAICHEMISIGERGRQLPCNHIFHYWCITKWFSSHTQISCPLCRDESR